MRTIILSALFLLLPVLVFGETYTVTLGYEGDMIWSGYLDTGSHFCTLSSQSPVEYSQVSCISKQSIVPFIIRGPGKEERLIDRSTFKREPWFSRKGTEG